MTKAIPLHPPMRTNNANEIEDVSTVENPHQYSKGVDYVFVNGQAVVDGGTPTLKLSGSILDPPRPR